MEEISMAWNWSHTQEAKDSAWMNLAAVDLAGLEVIYAEWKGNVNGYLNKNLYIDSLREAKRMSVTMLVNYIWKKAEEQGTCTNGGHQAWMCPFGCPAHMVPFD
jgi:hypothetical protein